MPICQVVSFQHSVLFIYKRDPPSVTQAWELVLSSEMRQEWIRVSKDFSPFLILKSEGDGTIGSCLGSPWINSWRRGWRQCAWLEAYLVDLEVVGQSASNCIQLPSHHRCFPPPISSATLSALNWLTFLPSFFLLWGPATAGDYYLSKEVH